MPRVRIVLPVVLQAILALAWLSRATRAEERPNVVLIVIDTLRADHLGCYGYARPTSPRLDALAATGTRFAAARATSSWTAPSVASILTGLYPLNHGLQLPSSRLPQQAPLMAAAFHKSGYHTVAFSANPAFVSERQGFNRGFDQFFVLHSGVAEKDDVDVVPGFEQAGNTLRVATSKQVTDNALEWLKTADTSQPFFLYLHYFDPHGGYYPPPEYAKRFGVSPKSPMLTTEQRKFWTQKPDPADLETLKSLYDGEIAFADTEIGLLLDKLPHSRPLLIAVTADHGEEFMDHGGMTHGRTLFEEMLRVPMFFAGDGVKQGAVVQQAVMIADVWPTLAELAGLPPPPSIIDGRSLASSVREGTEPPARLLFADIVKANVAQEMIHTHALLSGSQKLLVTIPDGYAFYNLDSDPEEKHDVYPQEETETGELRRTLAVRESRARNLTGWRRRPAPTVSLSEKEKEQMRALGYNPD